MISPPKAYGCKSKKKPFPEFAPLVLVKLKSPRTFKQLSTDLGIVPSTLSRTLKYLRKKAAVTIGPIEGRKGRSKHLYILTAKGRSLLSHAGSFVKAREKLSKKMTWK